MENMKVYQSLLLVRFVLSLRWEYIDGFVGKTWAVRLIFMELEVGFAGFGLASSFT